MPRLDGYTKIAEFEDHNLAALIRARLESEGIQVVIPYEFTSALRIPFVFRSQVLYVRDEDEQAALDFIEHGAPIDDELGDPEYDDDEVMTNAGEEVAACPNCAAITVRLLPAPLMPSLLSIFVPGYSLESIPSRWHCLACDEVWQE